MTFGICRTYKFDHFTRCCTFCVHAMDILMLYVHIKYLPRQKILSVSVTCISDFAINKWRHKGMEWRSFAPRRVGAKMMKYEYKMQVTDDIFFGNGCRFLHRAPARQTPC